MNVAATTTVINATIIAVIQEQRRKVLAHFNDQQALTPDSAIARVSVARDLQPTLDQLRAQGIIKDSDVALSYLDAEALLADEKKMAKGARTALKVLVPVMVAVAVAVVVAITLSR